MTLLPLITTSEQRCFKTCQRKHHFRYHLLRELIRSSAPAAYFGSLAHFGMEHLYRAWLDGGDRLDRALTMMRGKWTESDMPCEHTLAKATALVVGYFFRWKDAPIAILAVEAQFRGPLINPDTGARSRTYDLGGMMDVVIRDEITGDALFMEHKTTSLDIEPGSDYWARLAIDDQVSNYFDGARFLGFDVRGCLYDVLKRPSQEPRMATPEESRKYTQPKACNACKETARAHAKADGVKLLVADIPLTEGCDDCEPARLYSNLRDHDETPSEYGERIALSISEAPDDYYKRTDVVRLDDELYNARRDVWSTAKQIRHMQLTGSHVRNTGACTQYNSRCDYFQVCDGTADLSDPTIFTDRESKHSELSESPIPKEQEPTHDSISRQSTLF